MIQIKGLRKAFKHNQVLANLDLNLNQPGITALLGPNGSGKTTLVKSILGMVIPDTGSIMVNGTIVKRQHAYRSDISYLPQIARFPSNLTGHELLKFIKKTRPGAKKDKELIALFGLEKELNKKTSILSGGTRQKLNLVLAFMYDSPFVILDEPSTGLDPLALIQLKKYLRSEIENGKQILLITHILSLVEELAIDIVFINEGKIYYHGNLHQLIEQEGVSSLEIAIANILRNDAPHS